MNVIEIKLKGLDEVVYYDCCDNGLPIYVWVNKKVNTFKGTITFLVGGEDVSFSIRKKKYTIPFGTAHFLEHILCKNDQGKSLLEDFQKLGSYSNASTYPYRTTFEFVGTEHFFQNMELLLNSVQEKEFVDEYIEAERGPIIEEARMRSDEPARVILQAVNDMVYKNYPNHVSGLGTMEDINRITKSDLELLYHSFYHPKNSFVTVTGNVDPLEVITFIKNNQKEKTFAKYQKPILQKYREPKKVVQRYLEVPTNLEVPKVLITVKIPMSLYPDYDKLQVLDAIGVILSSNFGITSLLREDLITRKVVLSLSSYISWYRDYFVLQVESKTKYPDEVIPILKQKLEHLDFISEDIERKRKAAIANLVLGYEDPENVNDMINYCICKYQKIIDNEKEMLENFQISEIKDILSRISMKEMAVLVAYPKKDEN